MAFKLEKTSHKPASISLSIAWLSLTLKFPNSLLLKIANNVLISILLEMCLFGNLVVILVSSNNLQKIVRVTCSSKDAAMRIC